MRPLTLLAFIAVPALAQTTAPSLQNLVQNSPFGSAAAAGQPAAAAGPLEFRGTFVDRGERFFSILDTAGRRAEWVGLNDTGHAFQVKSYDPDNETVTLDYQGRSLSLKLRTARITAMTMPAPQPGPQNQPTAAGGPGQNFPPVPSAAPTPSTTEAQRLAQVAEEIRRRRALRQQAQQQPPQPGAQPPPNR
jgi:hypothetical protein